MELQLKERQDLEDSVKEIFARRDRILELERKQKRRVNSQLCRIRKSEGVAPVRRTRNPPSLPLLHMAYVSELSETLLCNFISYTYSECYYEWSSEFIHTERGLIHLLFANGHYKQVHIAIGSIKLDRLPSTWLLELEDIWYQASYHLAGPTRVDELTPVKRYRLRRRTPCPTEKLTGRRKYKIHEAGRRILESEYKSNIRPKRKDKEKIVSRTGLSYETVTNWFKNKRQRLSEPKVRSDLKCLELVPYNMILPEPVLQSQGYSSPSSTGYGSQTSGYSSTYSSTVNESATYKPEVQYQMPVKQPHEIIQSNGYDQPDYYAQNAYINQHQYTYNEHFIYQYAYNQNELQQSAQFSSHEQPTWII